MGPLIFTQIVPETKLKTALALAHYTKPTIANQRLEMTIVLESKTVGKSSKTQHPAVSSAFPLQYIV